ncbi:hypothetical protein F5877DRAFT_43263 [Lentinula edodes]|nr:hypothetical protein F5877DRAFT_43263 [Lentinula edodes]
MSSRSVLQGTLLICKSILSLPHNLALIPLCPLSAATSAFGTGIHGILTAQSNTGLRVFSAGVNGGISGATFFSIRELAVNPLLVATLPYGRKEGIVSENSRWSGIRTDRLLESAISGFFTGGILRGVTRNLRAVSSGAISAGVICTLLQYMYNESRIIRLKYLVHQRENSATSSRDQRASNSSLPWTERLLGIIGIKAVSDEEHLISLKQQRDAHLKRIAELEKVEREDKDVTG